MASDERWISIAEMNDQLISCRKCPRLVHFREAVVGRDKRFRGQAYWARPVPGYGDINGHILIVGLAPAASGGNRTGRVFTGDKSSDFLVSCLHEVGITNQPTSESRDDGLKYNDAYITAAVKCVPPDNKPTPEEITNCSVYLRSEISMMKNLRVILVLGQIAFQAVLKLLADQSISRSGYKFSHGAVYSLNGVSVVCSYHPSPRNVNTGKLSRDDFIGVLKKVKELASN
ncbi:uracil-DNA glycosylase [Thermoplasma sp. Kam2015]|uniref:uracil-DNA glycosylase n=1 Tax=Thermoplasma sp. Kam2015 TaxID=2094122 RepID=UPI000D8A440F|nr:uracil-DNA glycosylase [Thermoplasma sp. Kam2015]PYB68743.1 uracil-DNA glycosylase [Thermoplasma sp. Kam2015]